MKIIQIAASTLAQQIGSVGSSTCTRRLLVNINRSLKSYTGSRAAALAFSAAFESTSRATTSPDLPRPQPLKPPPPRLQDDPPVMFSYPMLRRCSISRDNNARASVTTMTSYKQEPVKFSLSSENRNDDGNGAIDNKQFRTSENSNNTSNNGRPPLEKILFVKEAMIKHLPNFFKEAHPYILYTSDVIFENFYHEPGRTYIGALQYAIQLTFIRVRLNWKFSHVRIEILKITHDENDATIKIRWRVSGVGGLKTMVQWWRLNMLKMKSSIKKEAEWIDGFSILYLNKNGLIYKHTLQRVMTQQEEATDKVTDKKKLKNLAINPTMCSKTD